MKFYLMNQCHTIASTLRTALEHSSDGLEFVSCTHLHPLDEHLEVEVPSEKFLRDALLDIKDSLKHIRADPTHGPRGSRHV